MATTWTRDIWSKTYITDLPPEVVAEVAANTEFRTTVLENTTVAPLAEAGINTPTGTNVTVDNPVIGHHPDGTNYTRVDDIEATAEQTKLAADNNAVNISGVLATITALSTRVADLEARSDSLEAANPVTPEVAAALADPTPGEEIATGKQYLGRERIELLLTQQSTGKAITGDNADVVVLTGIYEIISVNVMIHIEKAGVYAWQPAPIRATDGEIDFYVTNDGNLVMYDNHPHLAVQNWRAYVIYTKR